MGKVHLGIDRFFAQDYKRYRGMRIGLLLHQASVDSQFRHLLDLCRLAKLSVTAIYGPEHGLWGTAQDQIPVAGHRDPSSGIPVFSLYGDDRAPKAEWLENIDVMICDLQDVGSRYYTFVWTMALAMQACAKAGKKFVVLDRPNPIGGDIMEGPVLDLNFASFVGLYAAPVRHGLTIGEMAQWVNSIYHVGADLEIIPIKGWRRTMSFSSTGLPWVAPSPNMPTVATALVYPGACLIEGTNLSEGRGTTAPFELLGAPFINPQTLSVLLNSDKLPGVHFRACWFEPTFHKFKEQSCGAIQTHVTDAKTFRPFMTTLMLIKRTYDLYPKFFAWRDPPYEYEYEKLPFDILCGTAEIREAIEAGQSFRILEQKWKEQISLFSRERRPFLLYN